MNHSHSLPRVPLRRQRAIRDPHFISTQTLASLTASYSSKNHLHSLSRVPLRRQRAIRDPHFISTQTLASLTESYEPPQDIKVSALSRCFNAVFRRGTTVKSTHRKDQSV